MSSITNKHTYIILTPLKPHFYIVKQWFTGVYIILLISAQKHRLWVLVRTASAKISECLSENFQFLVVKLSKYLNRRVFEMTDNKITEYINYTTDTR